MILLRNNFLILSCLISFSLYADWAKEKQKIDYLIQEIKKIDGKFIRNGKEHTSQEAAEHIKMKLKNALSSWFTPRKEKWTAEMFIERVASKSSLSGKPYLIKFRNSGTTIQVENWLKEKLKSYTADSKTSK